MVDAAVSCSNIPAEMPASTTLLQFLLMLAASWLHRQQAAVIEYLKAENGLLRERLVFFVIELATRRVRIAGITVQPDPDWMMQIGRNLLDVFEGPLLGKQYLVVDRDIKYCAEFRLPSRERAFR
jgi:hypothetical protein